MEYTFKQLYEDYTTLLAKREKIIQQIERLSKTLCENGGHTVEDQNLRLTQVTEQIEKLVFDLKNKNILIKHFENLTYSMNEE